MKNQHQFIFANENFGVEAAEKPIFLPFGQWPYNDAISQSFDRPHAEAISARLDADVAAGNPGIPVYQGHPDVPQLAAKYPDKGALGWIKRMELSETGVNLFVEWDRFPGKGFAWFSPFWFGAEQGRDADGRRHVVIDAIRSVGLVNNPNISEFRLPNEAADLINPTKETTNMDKAKLAAILGLPPETPDDQVYEAVAAAVKAREQAEAAKTKAEAAKAQADEDALKVKTDLENERKAHADTRTALANEKAAHDRTRALKTQPATKGLANERTDGKTRLALVNELMAEKHLTFAAAWDAAKTQNPDLFK